MPKPSNPSPPQPVTLNYSTPRPAEKPTRASYVALILAAIASAFFLMLVRTIWGAITVGSRPLFFYLWVAFASAGFVAGVRGLADLENDSGLGRMMSWVGVSVGALTFLLLMVVPVGAMNLALLLVIFFLAFVVLNR
jgi:hypothetical protein